MPRGLGRRGRRRTRTRRTRRSPTGSRRRRRRRRKRRMRKKTRVRTKRKICKIIFPTFFLANKVLEQLAENLWFIRECCVGIGLRDLVSGGGFGQLGELNLPAVANDCNFDVDCQEKYRVLISEIIRLPQYFPQKSKKNKYFFRSKGRSVWPRPASRRTA